MVSLINIYYDDFDLFVHCFLFISSNIMNLSWGFFGFMQEITF